MRQALVALTILGAFLPGAWAVAGERPPVAISWDDSSIPVLATKTDTPTDGGTRATVREVPGTYTTIQAAIDAADPNDTVLVSGTHTEPAQIVVNKNLTIRGLGGSGTVVQPGSNTTVGGNMPSESFIYVPPGVTALIRDLTIDGSGRTINHAIQARGNLTVWDCVIKNIYAGTYYGRGIVFFSGTGAVERCVFTNIQRIGVHIRGNVTTPNPVATINGCAYTGKGVGDWLDYAFEIGGGGAATISNCTATACSGEASTDGSTSAGILITDYWGTGTAGTVLGCLLTGNTTGIAVGYDASDASVVVAHYNDLAGNASWGITSTNPAVNAEKNWWGTTTAAAIAGMVSVSVDYTPYLLSNQIRMAFGGNRLAQTQYTDGGWGWPVVAPPTYANIHGPITMGLAKAYRATSDPDLRAALVDAGLYLLAKTNNFSPSDGYLAAELDQILGGTTYVNHLNAYYYGPLASGTYNRNGEGTLYNTAAYVSYIRARRSGIYANLAAWDVGMGLVGAASCGVTGSELNLWIAGVEAEINELNGGGAYPGYAYYDVVGLAGALYGLAFVGQEFDPTTGEHATASNLDDLGDILASYQITVSGGFAWTKNYVIPYDGDEATQETAYAILALEAVGGHDAAVAAAKGWLATKQLGTGGWDNYVGDPEGENNEVTAEAMWGTWASGPATLTLVPDDECYANGQLVIVELWMNDVPEKIVGGQFFLGYDPNDLTFVSATAEAPFAQLYLQFPAAGQIDYGLNAPFGDPGVSGTQKMAELRFTAARQICTEADLLTWRPHNPPTRLSASLGQAVYPEIVNLDVVDDVAPVLAGCPANVTVECDAVPAAATVTATDNCDPAPVLDYAEVRTDGACPDSYALTRTWTATDRCSNVASCTQVITVQDTTPPVLTDPNDVTFECDGSGNAADLNGWLATHGGAVATDNCGDVTWTYLPNPAVLSDDCGATGAVTVTFTATDDCGNFSDTTATFTILDTTPPVLTVPDNATFECDGSGNVAQIAAWLASASATDACGSAVVTDDYTGLSDLCGATGSATVTFTATDACGLTSTAVRTVTVADTTPPVLTVPDNATFECDGSGNVAQIAAWLASASATDACGSAVVTDDYTGLSDLCGATGSATVTFTATDACGLTSTAVRTVTVADTTAPVISGCPVDIYVNADAGGCNAVVTWTEPTATDVCCGAVPWITRSHTPGDTFPHGATPVTYAFTDSCGQTATCSFTVHVSAFNEMLVSVELSPTIDTNGPAPDVYPQTLTRCITFDLWECPETAPATVNEVLTFTKAGAGLPMIATNASVLVPCGNYTCITARDKLHTLRRKADMVDAGTYYTADFTGDPTGGGDWLIGGNLNDDFWIDILDFGVFSYQWNQNYGTGNTTCSTVFPHADVNGSGIVDTQDFTFIQINFLDEHEANCCGMAGLSGPDGGEGPVISITVSELQKRGLGHLAVSDLTGDGVLDEADVAAFLMGARPLPRPEAQDVDVLEPSPEPAQEAPQPSWE